MAAGDDDDELHTRLFPRFNGFEVRQSIDLRSISLVNLQEVPDLIRERLSGLITSCSQSAADGSVLNVVLRGPSLAADVQAVLVAGDDYNADLFMDHISQVMQSNDTGLTDDVLELVVTGVHNKRGGVRLK